MINIGIIFGGPSREREISFAGGRTVYDNLNKTLFTPVPLFVDSNRNFILLDWEYIYKGTIRDFYPPPSMIADSPHQFQVYVESLANQTEESVEKMASKVGRKVDVTELSDLMDVAFLCLHGEFGEDGQIQGLLESLDIPYTGSGIRACSIGIDKAFQKKIMEAGGFSCPKVINLFRDEWLNGDQDQIVKNAFHSLGSKWVVRPSRQGSSIGVSIVDDNMQAQYIQNAIDNAFFIRRLEIQKWSNYSEDEKIDYLRELGDIRSGLGFPISIGRKKFLHPEKLYEYLEQYRGEELILRLEAEWSESHAILESFIKGKEFSCIVLRKNDTSAVALPPTEIVKGDEVYDYRSKYLPGLSRKETPIQIEDALIHAIRKECVRLFHYLDFATYARIDGFINEEGVIFLNDPNTTSGMMPSSFFFHQAAEIGLNPSQFLTFIIRTSVQERANAHDKINHYNALLQKLDLQIETLKKESTKRKKIGVLLGGYSYERHISVESGRNIFEKLSSSEKYEPLPLFLSRDEEGRFEIHQLPINLLLKDNADDIKHSIIKWKSQPILEQIKNDCTDITHLYSSASVVFEPKKLAIDKLYQEVDGVFIALHGRPGEDGTIQRIMEKQGVPYNGSGPESSSITIDKFRTLEILRQHGFRTADQWLLKKEMAAAGNESTISQVENRSSYPFVMKPLDDGCSSAVRIIRNRDQLEAYLKLMFRNDLELDSVAADKLAIGYKEEFPRKKEILVESLIDKEDAAHFLEITCGLMTTTDSEGNLNYTVFEPSEALAGGEVLSLEEKFLAGEGQNITPARFGKNLDEYNYISSQVKSTLEKAARLLNVRGYARIDAFVRIFEDQKVETLIIEVNSLPGMTPATCIFHQSAIAGMKPYDFIDQILEFGFHERERKQVAEKT